MFTKNPVVEILSQHPILGWEDLTPYQVIVIGLKSMGYIYLGDVYDNKVWNNPRIGVYSYYVSPEGRIREGYSWEESIVPYLQVYEEIIGKARKYLTN